MRSVAVLMSVYNAEQFLVEQIDSILSQEGVEVFLFIRDDGSTDKSPEIAKRYAADRENVQILIGHNLGAKDGFLSLIGLCPFDVDYYAYSDADDVWFPDKLRSAVDVLEAMAGDPDVPALYTSGTQSADADLKVIGKSAPLYRPLSFSNALVECRVAGATAVFNKAARQVLRRYEYRDAVMHDAWLYLVISAFGRLVYDDRAFMLYRQHGGNLVGGPQGVFKSWRRRLSRAALCRLYRQQAEGFYSQAAADLPTQKREQIRRFVEHPSSLLNRVLFALKPTVRHQRLRSDLVLRLLTIAGRT